MSNGYVFLAGKIKDLSTISESQKRKQKIPCSYVANREFFTIEKSQNGVKKA